MTNEAAPLTTRATVNSFSIGSRHYEQRMNDCGKRNCRKCGGAGLRKPSHGPYWYLCVLARGAWRRIYLGKELDTGRFITEDGTVDWHAVKEKRVLKTYVETTNHDVPGQLSILPDVPDLALEHEQPTVHSSARDRAAAPDVGRPDAAPEPRPLANSMGLFHPSTIVPADLSLPPGYGSGLPSTTSSSPRSLNQSVSAPPLEAAPETPAAIALIDTEAKP